MKATCMLWFIALCTVALWPQAPSDNASLALSVAAEKTSIKAGDPVSVRLEVKNLSDHDIDLSANIDDSTDIDPNFVFEVRDGHGNVVPKKAKQHPELAFGHPRPYVLHPGKTLTEEESIGRLFDLSRPGRYTVRVSCSPRHSTQAAVTSNPVTLTIIQ